MVILQTTSRGTHLVSIPKSTAAAMGWTDGEELALCPCDNGVLRLVPLRGRGLKHETS